MLKTLKISKTSQRHTPHLRVQKCPNTGFFLVRIFPHSDWIRRDNWWKMGYFLWNDLTGGRNSLVPFLKSYGSLCLAPGEVPSNIP